MYSRDVRVLCATFLCMLVAGCSGSHQQAEERALERSLAAVKGEYVRDPGSSKYRYTAKPQLEAILSPLPKDETVSGLVACLDSMTPSQSVLEGQQVPLGVVCYEALSQTVYHEPHDAKGDIAKDWPGHISPTASAGELRAAKKAWTEVLRTKTYTFL